MVISTLKKKKKKTVDFGQVGWSGEVPLTYYATITSKLESLKLCIDDGHYCIVQNVGHPRKVMLSMGNVWQYWRDEVRNIDACTKVGLAPIE